MSRIIKPNFEHKDERGTLREITRGQKWHQLNEYERKKGSIAGNHYHKTFDEFFFIIRGRVDVKICDITTNKTEEFVAKAGDAFVVNKNEVHAFKFMEDTIFITLLSENFDESNPDIYKKVILEN